MASTRLRFTLTLMAAMVFGIGCSVINAGTASARQRHLLLRNIY
jgi:hypothetical protein